MILTRSEKVRFKFTVDKKNYEDRKTFIDGLSNRTGFNVEEGDKLDITYDVNIEYFGDVTENLERMLRILDNPEIMVDVGFEELNYGEILLDTVLQKLRKVRDVIKGRNQ